MPALYIDRPTVTITLPYSKAKVELYEFLLSGQERDIERVALKHTPLFGQAPQPISRDISLDMQDQLIVEFIAKWDFTETDGTEVAPSLEALKALHRDDFEVLDKKVNKLSAAYQAKKNTKA